MNKYIIVNAETIQKRIEELEKNIRFYSNENMKLEANQCLGAADVLKQILSNSKPLEEELGKALKEGMLIQRTINDKVKIPATRIKDYINNLKLGI